MHDTEATVSDSMLSLPAWKKHSSISDRAGAFEPSEEVDAGIMILIDYPNNHTV